jgi:DNA-directed RNA polymerase I, II, and III subunit RPABC2
MSAFDDEPDIFNESDDEEIDTKKVVDKGEDDVIDDDNDDDNDVNNDDDGDDNDDDDDDDDDDITDEVAMNDDKKENEKPFSNNNNLYLLDDDNFYESDSDNDEDYVEKFTKETSKETIMNYYPEHIQHNIDEIDKMSVVVRDENGAIIDPLHKTVPFLTKYERARIIGERAKQLEYGSKPFITVEQNEIDSYLIAEKEYLQKAIPFIIKRPLPNGSCEYWKLKDLEIM